MINLICWTLLDHWNHWARVAFTLHISSCTLLTKTNEWFFYVFIEFKNKLRFHYSTCKIDTTQQSICFRDQNYFIFMVILRFIHTYFVHIWFKGQIKVTEIVLKLNSNKRVGFFLSVLTVLSANYCYFVTNKNSEINCMKNVTLCMGVFSIKWLNEPKEFVL